jgi:hypothetical protein
MTTSDFNAVITNAVRDLASRKRVSTDAIGAALVNRGGVSGQYVRRDLLGGLAKWTVADVLDLVAKLGPELLVVLAAERGMSLLVTEVRASAPTSPMVATSRAMIEKAEAQAAAARALADGVVTPSEAAEVRAEYHQAAEACTEAARAFTAAAV